MTGEHPGGPESKGPQRVRRRRRARALGAGTAVLVVLGVGTVVVLARPRPATSAPSAPAPPATAAVTRTDLAEQDTADGTLGYGDEHAVTARGRGTVTWLPEPGAVITRGHPVYTVDTRPVALFYGATPLYRGLGPDATDGPDVKEVEQNLAALGFDDFGDPDETFTQSTADAIKDWQDSLGMDQTGTLAQDSVVVQPGAIRVASVTAQPGAAAGGELMKITGTQRAVTVALDVAKQSIAKLGAKVSLDITGGSTTTGVVRTIGTAATGNAGNGTSTTGQDSGPATINVTISLDDQKAAGRLDSAPVQVTFTIGSRKNVLAVPVGALLALAEGGFAVDVPDSPDGARHHLVAVETGLFADGLVEVSGDLREGQRVVTTS